MNSQQSSHGFAPKLNRGTGWREETRTFERAQRHFYTDEAKDFTAM